MLVYLADLAHTHSTKNESLMVPLNIAYLKAYATKQHENNINIKLFKDPNELLKAFYKKCPDLLGLSNYGWNEDLNFKLGKFIKLEFPKTIIISGASDLRIERHCKPEAFFTLCKAMSLGNSLMLFGFNRFFSI